MTYDLRRLRLHGLIERLLSDPSLSDHRHGLRTALFYTRVYNRILRPGLAMLSPAAIDCDSPTRRRFSAMNDTIYSWCDEAKLAA